MAGSILGTRVLRTEDPELLVGGARYVGDLDLDNALHVAFVRSEMAHARIDGIDIADALEMPGVAAIHTADDLGLQTFHGMAKVHDDFARSALAQGVVRFVGEGIAVVLAETAVQARDAADSVIVDYDPLPAVIDAEAAFAQGAPIVFPDHGSNLAMSV